MKNVFESNLSDQSKNLYVHYCVSHFNPHGYYSILSKIVLKSKTQTPLVLFHMQKVQM